MTRARITQFLASLAAIGLACGDDQTADTSATATATATTTEGTTTATTEGTTATTTATDGTATATATTTDTTVATTSPETTTTTAGDTTTTGDTTTGGAEPLILEGFSAPESALWAPLELRWYVTNVGGDPIAKDGDGFISRIAADGTVEAMQWAAGFDAPKGLVMDDAHLYVADIDQVRVVDAATGDLLGSVPIDGAVFLSDMALDPQGGIYVADTATNTIYRLTGDNEMPAEIVATSADLHGPSAIGFANERLIVASRGDDMGQGALYWMMEMTPVPIGSLTGQLSGLVVRLDDFLVTEFSGKLYRIPGDGGPHELLRDLAAEDGLASAANLDYARGQGVVAVPDFLGDRVALIPIAE